MAVTLLLIADESHSDRDAVADGVRTDSSTSMANRTRLSNEPPYSSLRRLYAGEKNSWMRYPCVA